MNKPYAILSAVILCAFGWLPISAVAQAPYVTGLLPQRNAVNIPRVGSLDVLFSAPVAGSSALRVQSSQWDGYRAGTGSGDGTNRLSFQPRRAFAPGEKVSLTVPAAVHGSSGAGAAVVPGVYQFQATAAPASATFLSPLIVGPASVGYYEDSPILADFTGDDNVDLLISGNQLELYPGDGQGHFANTPLTALNSLGGIAEAKDVNEDGRLDLITSVQYDSARVWLGDGRGQFRKLRAFFPVNNYYVRSETGDFNADSHLDVLLFLLVPVQGVTTFVMQLCLGDGRGNFTPGGVTVLPSNSNSQSSVADVNNDGKLDILISHEVQSFGSSNYTSYVETYLGNGLGSFALLGAPVTVSPNHDGPAALPFEVADLNHDGIVDLAHTNQRTGQVQFYLGTGTGSFGPSTTLPFPTNIQGTTNNVKIADVDGDGDLDILQPCIYTLGVPWRPQVTLWRNNGTGTFAAPTFFAFSAISPRFADLNNDGTLDIVSCFNNPLNGLVEVNVRLNQALATAPTITSFSPTTAAGGATVTVSGTSFTGATAVLVGGVPVAGFSVVSGTTITFTLPAGVSGGPITVLTPSGQATSASRLLTPTATRAAAALSISLYPNPVHATAYLSLPSDVRTLQVELFDGLGRPLRTLSSPVLLPGGTASLDVSYLRPGMYVLRLSSDGRSSTQKLVVD